MKKTMARPQEQRDNFDKVILERNIKSHGQRKSFINMYHGQVSQRRGFKMPFRLTSISNFGNYKVK